MKAVIMAGGEGTRLRPLTCGISKPMVPIANKPVMEHIINLLSKNNIVDIAATLYYLPLSITDYFGSGEKFNVNLKYYIEEKPLGTGGSVLNASDFLDDTFIVISGDALTDIDIDKVYKFHKNKKSKATMVLKKEAIPLEYGIVITDKDGRIIRFLEKPSWGEVFSDTVNTGIYIIEPEVLKYYKKGDNFDFSKDLFPRLLKDNIPMFGYVTDAYWCDIGDLCSYKQTHFDILNKNVRIKNSYKEIEPGIFTGNNSYIEENVKIKGPVIIGDNCIIKRGSVIDAYSIIGDNCEIEESSSIKRSILWNNVHIGKSVQLRGTVIGNRVNLKCRVNAFEDSVIGPNCIINEGATVKPGIKIWPQKTIKEETTVSKNLVWGTRLSKQLFGSRDISGDLNIDISPEFTSLISSAFASVIKKNAPVIVSGDGSKSAEIIRLSAICGLQSAGKDVININNIIIPAARFAVKLYQASGGIYISSSKLDINDIHIEFMNEKGGNIDRLTEKKIEHLFIREDFERCGANLIGNIINIDNFASFYVINNIPQIRNIDIIKSRQPKVIISSKSENVMKLASNFLQQIGCSVDDSYSLRNYESYEELIHVISREIKRKNLNAGAIISDNGESIILFDEDGSPIDADKYNLLTALILLKFQNIKKIIIPCTASMAVEKIAKPYGAEVVRTKSSASCIMNEMLCDKSSSAYLQYIFNFDGILALGKIIDCLYGNSTTISKLENEIPELFMKKEQIICDFNDRGKIIREFIEENKQRNVELFEGVKINTSKGWTLVLPDNEKPVFNIYTEGFSEEYAKELSYDVTGKLKKLMKIPD